MDGSIGSSGGPTRRLRCVCVPEKQQRAILSESLDSHLSLSPQTIWTLSLAPHIHKPSMDGSCLRHQWWQGLGGLQFFCFFLFSPCFFIFPHHPIICSLITSIPPFHFPAFSPSLTYLMLFLTSIAALKADLSFLHQSLDMGAINSPLC